MGTEANLIAGPLDVWVGPVGEAVPDFDDIAPSGIVAPTPAGNWVQVGFSQENFSLKYDPDYQKVNVNEVCAPIKAFPKSEEGSMSYTMAEQDLTAYSQTIATSTLTTVAAGADQTGQDVVGIGSGGIAEKSLLFYGRSPEGASGAKGSRVIHVFKAYSGDSSEWAQGREMTGQPITWEFLADSTQSDGSNLFTIHDITAAATS
jgi:hypothetical protein